MQIFRPIDDPTDELPDELAPIDVLAGVRRYLVWTFVILLLAICVICWRRNELSNIRKSLFD